MEPYLRAGVLENYRSTVERLGGQPDELLARAGVAREALDIAGTYLHYRNYLQLHHITARELRCPHFGLEMSRVASAETLGITGFIMLQAQTVGEAWATLAHFNRYHDNYGQVALLEAGGMVGVEYRLPQADMPGARGAFDTAASIAVNIMRQLCGRDWRPASIVQAYAEPEDLAPYRHLAADRLQFDGDAFQMYFSPAAMDRPLSINHPGIRQVLGHYLDSIAPAGASSTRTQVEELIRGLLPLGNCSLDQVAAMLSISRRGLQARLAAENSSFQQLLDRVRQDIAAHHMRSGDMQLTQLAMILGYSELSAFSRSFRRWYGVSPRQWLKQRPLPG